MYQIELEYRHFKNIDEKIMKEWATFYNVKVIEGMCYIFRSGLESSLYNFLKRIGLEDKTGQIRRLR